MTKIARGTPAAKDEVAVSWQAQEAKDDAHQWKEKYMELDPLRTELADVKSQLRSTEQQVNDKNCWSNLKGCQHMCTGRRSEG